MNRYLTNQPPDNQHLPEQYEGDFDSFWQGAPLSPAFLNVFDEIAAMGVQVGVTMSDKMLPKLRRLILSQEDVQQAIDIAQYILEHSLWDEAKWSDARLIGRGLQTAMVVSYIRPFSGNFDAEHTFSRPRIDIDKLLTEPEWRLHQEIKEMRDTVFAHTDAEQRNLSLSLDS